MERVQIRGLPKGTYQVQCKTKEGWMKLVQAFLPSCGSGGSDGNYYQFTEDGKWNLSDNKFKGVEEVTYDDWKQAIESHIKRVGDFKVGDLVYITKGYFDLKEGDVRALDGFDGMHWWIKTKEYPKIFLDKDENFRHATKEEIAAYENKTTPKTEFKVGDWVTTNSKITFQIAEISNQGSIWYRKTKGGIDGVLAQTLRFATLEEIVAVQGKSEPVVRKDGWKVGDKLPAEFLNLCTYYTKAHDIYTGTNAEDDEEDWDNDRVVATVTSQGWAQISRTGGAYYLSNKHEYLEYDHYENPKTIPASATVSASASNIMVTKDNAVVGLEVVRGRDWNYGDQDHVDGKQVVGVIVHETYYFPSNKNSGWVRVQWKGGRNDSYEIGDGLDNEDGKYDLYVYQGSTEPVKEPAKEPVKSTWFAEQKQEKEEVKKTVFVECVNMKESTANFVVGQVYEAISETNDFYYFKGGEGMFKFRFKEVKGKDPLQIPVGWKPGDSWRHKNEDCGLSISVHPKDDDFNSYFVDFGETGTSWLTVNKINEFVAEGFWIINPEQKSKQKEDPKPIGWKPGDRWKHANRDNNNAKSISVYPNQRGEYYADYGGSGAWFSVNDINGMIAEKVWIITSDQKGQQKEESQTIIISKQTNTKTKQDETIKESNIGNSISITEQCFISSSYQKSGKTTYVPGDEERITAGQRRKGSAVRG
jgi:hypothetical protein